MDIDLKVYCTNCNKPQDENDDIYCTGCYDELQDKIKELESQIDDMESQMADLEDKIAELEKGETG